jgi:hypothetical protein
VNGRTAVSAVIVHYSALSMQDHPITCIAVGNGAVMSDAPVLPTYGAQEAARKAVSAASGSAWSGAAAPDARL